MKVLREADKSAEERFRREAQVPAMVRHSAFAEVLDWGDLDDGRPYLVAEWSEGQMLDMVLRERGRLSVSDVVAFGRRIAEGLARLHEIGIIHRDIKPSNIIIPGLPNALAFGEAKLLDFGAFGTLTKESSGRLTQAGVLVGTPRYMAPEQILALPQSTATDVYGLALLMVEMLYGALPFEEPGKSAISIMIRMAQSDPELPYDISVPEPLRALLGRSLSRDPASRPPNGAAFVKELNGAWSSVGPSPALPNPLSRELAVHKSSPRGRLVIATGLILTALAVVVATRPWLMRPVIGTEAILWIFIGVGLIMTGVVLGNVVRGLAKSRLHLAEVDTGRLLLGVRSRGLSETVQVEVREIITRCRQLDERVLGVTILKMIDEYDVATASDDRQAALMNVASLLERLRGRLSPWYARFDKQLALATTTIGLVSGLVSIAAGILKIVKGQP
jgi:serine/threonine-protein kinase